MSEVDIQSVLVIDDSEDMHNLIAVRLRPEQVDMLHAYDADSALALMHQRKPDLILLDLNLPGLNGLELCRRIKYTPEWTTIPIIFLTGTVDVEIKVLAFDAGAIDYITKPFDGIELRARVRAALRTKRYQDLLATKAQLDGLTGLWNRAYFDDRLAEECALARRHRRQICLILFDIDFFKSINDRYGHPFGDLVLQRVSKVLTTHLRQTEIACRYGGEEFAVILRETGLQGGEVTAERLRVSIAELSLVHGREPVNVTVSLGISANQCLTTNEIAPAELLKSADEALYRAKQSGRNRSVRAC